MAEHERTPAPMPLRQVEEFINTRRADGDDFATPAELAHWLQTKDLIAAGTVITEEQRVRAETVREGLRALIAENNDPPVASPRPDGLDPAARGNLAELARQLPLALDLSAHPPRLTPQSPQPVDNALATLLGLVAEAVAAGTWSRLKACREPSCRWAFYDYSRNRRRTWCSMDLCGNRAKARSHHRKTSTTG